MKENFIPFLRQERSVIFIDSLNAFFYHFFGAILFCIGISVFTLLSNSFDTYLNGAKEKVIETDQVFYEADAEIENMEQVNYGALIGSLLVLPECDVVIIPSSTMEIRICAGANVDTHVTVKNGNTIIYNAYYGSEAWNVAKFPFHYVTNKEYKKTERLDGHGNLVEITYKY